MSLLYQSAGFFTQNKMKMIQRSDVHYVIINISTNGFEFVGTNFNLPNFHKDSTGFRFDVPWSYIKNIIKTKERMMHVIIIHTLDDFYTILPLDPQTTSGLGISSSKKNSKDLLATINKAKAQVDASKSKFCTNCGEQIKPDSDFCGNCGYKLL